MTSLTAYHIPAPKHYQAFESLCLDLWKREWNASDLQKNGRTGQPQNGVDISGWHSILKGYAAIQCKCINPSKSISINDIEKDIQQAKNFQPPIKILIFATTGIKDAKLEQQVREISERNSKDGLFTVNILGWEDIVHLLWRYEEIIQLHFPILQPLILKNETHDFSTGLMDSKYSFSKEEFIHPLIVKELIGWISDRSVLLALIYFQRIEAINSMVP